ncbi:MAG: MFS transporter, partial [Paludibacter sp.]|jgi:sugar phosphate permease|nr:MFS transporter [Paludibacter sp.]
MLMTNGIGAVLGNITAGWVIARWFENPVTQVKDWTHIWFIFAAYALVVAILFALIFKYKHEKE